MSGKKKSEEKKGEIHSSFDEFYGRVKSDLNGLDIPLDRDENGVVMRYGPTGFAAVMLYNVLADMGLTATRVSLDRIPGNDKPRFVETPRED